MPCRSGFEGFVGEINREVSDPAVINRLKEVEKELNLVTMLLCAITQVPEFKKLHISKDSTLTKWLREHKKADIKRLQKEAIDKLSDEEVESLVEAGLDLDKI